MKKIIGVVNQKGGVGKTTISINLACGIALKDHSVLLIDMDPQSNSTQGIGVEPQKKKGIHVALSGHSGIQEQIFNTEIDNLHIAPAHLDLGLIEKQLSEAFYRERILYNLIKKLNYKFIVIDCGPDLDNLAINSIFASNLIVVPLDMTKFALAGLSNVIDTINKIKNGESLSQATRLLLNKYDLRKKKHNEWYLEQLSAYRDLLLETKIGQDSSTEHAHSFEGPVFQIARSRAAGDFKKLTQEILNLCHQS